MFKNPFWNASERRVRSLWRVLLTFASFAGALTLGTQFAHGLSSHFLHSVAETTVALVPVVLVVWLAARFLDRRRLADLGLRTGREAWLELGFGIVLGGFLIAVAFVTLWGLGWISVKDSLVTHFQVPFLVAVLGHVARYGAQSVFEELFFRGYLIKNVAEGLHGPRIGAKAAVVVAWVFSSVLFGLLHGGNPNASSVAVFNLVLVGLLFGLGYVLSDSLAVPIGLHFAWNFFQGTVFGLPVSGQDWETYFLVSETAGPVLWTGGSFGLEGSLALTAVTVLGGALTWLWYRRRGTAGLVARIAEPPSGAAPDAGAPA